MDDLPLIAHDNVPQGPHTWAEFIDLDEDDLRELIDGEFIEVEVPTKRHEWVVGLIYHWIMGWALANRAGMVLPSGYKVRVTDTQAVMPDVQFYRKGNPVISSAGGKYEKGNDDGRPDLAVEIVSPSSTRYDRVTKLGWYAQIGVPEYWVVDPAKRKFERNILVNGKYSTETIDSSSIFKPETFPGLEIPLPELWKSPDEA